MTRYLKILFLAACLLWPHAAMAGKKTAQEIVQKRAPEALEMAAKNPFVILDAETLRTTQVPVTAMSPADKKADDDRGFVMPAVMEARAQMIETPFRDRTYYSVYSIPNYIGNDSLLPFEKAAAADGAIPVQAYLFYVYDAGVVNSETVGGYIQRLFMTNPQSRFGGSAQGLDVNHVYIDTWRHEGGLPFFGIRRLRRKYNDYVYPMIPGTAILAVGAVKDPALFERIVKLKADYQSDQRNFILEHAVILDRYIKGLRAGKLRPPPGSTTYDEACQAGRTQAALFYSHSLYKHHPTFYAGLNRQSLTSFAPNAGISPVYWPLTIEEIPLALMNEVKSHSAELYTVVLCEKPRVDHKVDWYTYLPNWLVLARAIDSVKYTLAKK